MLVDLYPLVPVLPSLAFPHVLRGQLGPADVALKTELGRAAASLPKHAHGATALAADRIASHILRARHQVRVSVESEYLGELFSWADAAQAIALCADGTVRPPSGFASASHPANQSPGLTVRSAPSLPSTISAGGLADLPEREPLPGDDAGILGMSGRGAGAREVTRSDIVDRYTLDEELGSGAFGKVYAARDTQTGQRVALKQLSRLSPNALSRFKQEFRAVQGLNHPNIVRLDRLLEHESGWWIAMELVEGTDLLGYLDASDDDPALHEHRLRTAFGQLADALDNLHQHGILHRDLKPANVRVDAAGRVVLLDFGIVKELGLRADSMASGAVGTPAYMAPEQASRRVELSAAADWYAFGVCLYEALSGSLPFDGDSDTVLFTKQNALPDPPSLRSGFPVAADLEALCMGLLAPEASARPRIADVRAVLSLRENTPSATLDGGDLEPSELFEGREEELAILTIEHQKARSQGIRLLLVEGESGIGKSALVTEWVRQLKQREPGVLLLKSQCYENEHSAFKAFDAGTVALARKLNRMGGKDGMLLPEHAGLLPRHFPALSSVKAVKNAPLLDVPAEPFVAVRSALVAFANLLKLIAANGTVVLVIDDLQWADPESFRLLRTLCEAAHAPHMLVLATIRPKEELDPEVTAELSQLTARIPVERISLGGLSALPCMRLARGLLTGSLAADWLERITAESKGHPLFVSVLSRYAESHRSSMSEELSLEAALGQKLNSLQAPARTLLELLAVAGVPCSLSLLSRALGVEAEQVQKRAAELVSAKLLRRLPHQQLACFHDRVRTIALSGLKDEQKVPLHEALATAISAVEGHDPALLALHLEGARRPAQALAAHHQAGDAALGALAFGKAEHHFGRALALSSIVGAAPSLVTTLRVSRGHALGRAGRSALAAKQYLEACEHVDEAERIALRVWAAQHLLQSGQVNAGLKAAREVLAELGAPLPHGEAAAITRIVWDRMCVGIRGLALPDSKREVSRAERAKLEAMWSLAAPVSWVEVLSGATLGTCHLRTSLAAGERTHVARALAGEALFAMMQKPDAPERPHMFFERARSLYVADEEPALEAWVLFNQGTAAVFRTDLVPACEKLEQAEALLRARCPEEPWLLTNVRSALASSWSELGQFGAQVPTIERWLAEATERDDPFALAGLETLGLCSLRFLLRDEPERVGEKVIETLAPWPREPFGYVHLGELIMQHVEAMYRANGDALQVLEADRARHERAFLLKTRFGKWVLLVYRTQASLSAYVAAGGGPRAAKYLDVARAASRALRRSTVPRARLSSPVLDAQLAVVDGHTERALELTRLAANQTGRSGLKAFEAPLTYLEGLLEGGDLGREKRDRALAIAQSQGWKNPRRCVAMQCPVIDHLEAKSR